MTKLVLWNDALKDEYDALIKSCVVHPDKEPVIAGLVEKLAKNQARYASIAKQIGCPWWFVGLIHYIECGFRFDRHLHNGDPLSAKTVRVPAGRPLTGKPPFTFEQSALDALRLKRFDEMRDWSLAKVLFFLEGYNGYGYRQYHPEVKTPYLWSFTNHYTKGKYTMDGHFDPNCVSQQAGLAAIIKDALNKGVITIAVLLCLALPSRAQDADHKTVPVMLESGKIVQMVVPKKQPFAVRHPKLHKTGRKIRRTCQVLQPVVSFAGSCAQVGSLFFKL